MQPTAYGGETDEELLAFTEPYLAFSPAGRDNDSATVRVHFSLEASPPWLRRDTDVEQPDLHDFFVEVQLKRSALAKAAGSWGQELLAFAVR